MGEEERDAQHAPTATRLVLSYRTPSRRIPTTTVRKFYDLMEAQLYANELDRHGIEYFLLNQNTNTLGPYSAFSQIELQVAEEDLEEASRILSLMPSVIDLEPPAGQDPWAPMANPDGPGMLEPLAGFENPRQMFDAAAHLGAGKIDCFVPPLAPRGEHPAGQGKRFVLRVPESDLERAREVLAQWSSDSTDEDEPRCPSCGSFRVMRVPRPWPGLLKFLFAPRTAAPQEMECLRYKHRWSD